MIAVSVRSPGRRACRTRHAHLDVVLDVDGELDLDRRADRQRRVEIGDDHLLDDAVLLEDRHDDAAGLVVGAAGAAGRRPAASAPTGATTCLTRCPPRLSTSICSGLVMSCVGSTAWPSGRPAPLVPHRTTTRAASRPSPSQTVSSRALSVSGCNSTSWAKVPRSSRNASSVSPVASERTRTEPPSSANADSGDGNGEAGRTRTTPVSVICRRRVCWPDWSTCSSQLRPVAVRCSLFRDPRKQVARAVAGRAEGGAVGDAQVRLVQQRRQSADVFRQVGVAEGGPHRLAHQRHAAGTADQHDIIDVAQPDARPVARPGPGRRGSSRWCDPPSRGSAA